MNCQACGLPLAKYDEYCVSCKNGHIWTLPEHADKPHTLGPDTTGKPLVRLVKAPAVPAWLPGAVLGGLALLIELVQLAV